jgi:Fur family ferric uptake transcriptional regulator
MSLICVDSTISAVPPRATHEPAVPAPESERQAWIARAFAVLSEAGYRAGGARTAVVETIGHEGGCLSADEVSARLRAGGRTVGTASVYRALNVLTELGALHGVSMPGAPLRFELVLPGGHHHHHVVCEHCGETASFQDPALEAAIERLSSRVAYDVDTHDVTLRGTCPACSRA